MTRLFDLPLGKGQELLLAFQNAGMTAEQALAIINDGNEARKVVAVLQPAWQPPSWWRTPDQQLAKARELWPDATLPDPPANFVPQSKTEVLLLHVPDTFDSLWDKVVAPSGYTKCRWDGVKSGKRDLRLAPNVPNHNTPVWLAFDPEHGKGERPDKFWGQANLAASEVFSALIQFPDWPLTWFNGASAPNLSGYQLRYDGSCSHVPYVFRWDDDRQLELGAGWAGGGDDDWASPVVRER